MNKYSQGWRENKKDEKNKEESLLESFCVGAIALWIVIGIIIISL